MSNGQKNVADPRQVKDAKQRAKLRREREVSDLKAVMSTPEGRRFVWRLLDLGQIFESRFRMNSLEMAFVEGNANLATAIYADIDAECPELFLKMRNEVKLDKLEATP